VPISNGNTLYVGGSGEGNYTTIQYAIDNASDGDTVFVYDFSSPYYENVVIDRSINLIGEDKENTIIDGNLIGSVIIVTTDWVNISGFTIQNSGEGWDKAGIIIYESHTTILGNTVSNNYNGIYLSSSSDNNISGNTVSYNKMSGIDIRCSSNNNFVIGNSAINNDDGIYLYESSNNNIINNTVSNNYEGIYLYSSNNNIISYNTISNNDHYSIHLQTSSSNNIIGNTILDNYYGIRLISSSSNIVSGNTVSNNRTGIALTYSDSNDIIGNTVSNNVYGLYFGDSSDNNIIGNTASNNNYGLSLSDYSQNNNVYHNNFIKNNLYNVYGEFEIFENTWDDGKYGNYWSDYEERYPDAEKLPFKGIWDTPYTIYWDNVDHCPLIRQWTKSMSSDSITRPGATFNSLFNWLLEHSSILERFLNFI